MPIEIKKLDSIELKDLVDIFLTVYNGPPWNDQWNRDQAENYLSSFIANPSFIGYTVYQNKRLVGACLGEKRYWWEGDEYFINEIFIDNSAQRQGIGSKFINQIQANLAEMGIRTITLLTDRDSAADQFYKNNGFHDKEIVTFKFKNY